MYYAEIMSIKILIIKPKPKSPKVADLPIGMEFISGCWTVWMFVAIALLLVVVEFPDLSFVARPAIQVNPERNYLCGDSPKRKCLK